MWTQNKPSATGGHGMGGAGAGMEEGERMETYPEDVVYNGTSERKTYEELHEIVDEIYNLCVERRLNYADFRMVLVYLQHKRVRLDSINSDIADRKVLFTLK